MLKRVLGLTLLCLIPVLFFHIGMFHQRAMGVECIDDIPTHFEVKHDAWSSVFKEFCYTNPGWAVETDLVSFECFENGYSVGWGEVE